MLVPRPADRAGHRKRLRGQHRLLHRHRRRRGEDGRHRTTTPSPPRSQRPGRDRTSAPTRSTASKIFDSTVSAADLGFASVASGEIATDAVNGSEVAANAIDSDEILDNSLTLFDLGQNSVNGPEITTGAVTSTELADNSVVAAKIPNGSLRAVELDGGRSNGAITLNSGFVANGRCRDVGISVPGADPGDAIIFSVNTDLPDGILLSGVRVIDDDVIQGKACNLTGGIFPQLNNIQVAILTISL